MSPSAVRSVVCICLAFALVPAIQAQEKQKPEPIKPAVQEDGVFKMTIWNGAVRTEHFFAPKDAKSAERESLRDVERLGTEVAEADRLVHELRAFRLQRIRDERQVAAARTEYERTLYGYRLPYPVIPNSFEFLNTVATPYAGGALLPLSPYAGPWGFPYGSFLAGTVDWPGTAPAGLSDQPRVTDKELAERLNAASAELAKLTQQRDAALAKAAGVSDRVREAVGVEEKGKIKEAGGDVPKAK